MTDSEQGAPMPQGRIVSLDRLGRKIVIRPPTALDTLRLFKAAGPVLAQNEPWLSVATLAYAVESIDDIPVPSPVSESQIEGLVARLGDVGLAAVNQELEKVEAEASLALVGN